LSDEELNIMQPEGGEMEKLLKALREQFKLSDDATEDQILEALTKALQTTEEEPVTESLSEEDVAKVLDEHPAMAAIVNQAKLLDEQNKTLVGRIAGLELEARESKVATKLSEWHAGGDTAKFGLPVALDEKVEAFMLSLSQEKANAFSEIVDELIKTGTVALGEKPRAKRTESEDSVTSQVETGIKELMEANESLSFADASEEFFRNNEDLYIQYLEEATNTDEEVDA